MVSSIIRDKDGHHLIVRCMTIFRVNRPGPAGITHLQAKCRRRQRRVCIVTALLFAVYALAILFLFSGDELVVLNI